MMNGLTDEQRKRLSLISCLEEDQKDYLIAGILGKLDALSSYNFSLYTQSDVAEEIIDCIDDMLYKAYEKGRYL